MKIAVSTDDFEHVSGHVGRCKGFIIFDVENGEIKNRLEVKNTFTHHAPKGSSKSPADGHNSLVGALKECDNLVCQSAGWRLVEELRAANIITIYTSITDAATAAIKLELGELDINEEGACHSH